MNHRANCKLCSERSAPQRPLAACSSDSSNAWPEEGKPDQEQKPSRLRSMHVGDWRGTRIRQSYSGSSVLIGVSVCFLLFIVLNLERRSGNSHPFATYASLGRLPYEPCPGNLNLSILIQAVSGIANQRKLTWPSRRVDLRQCGAGAQPSLRT